jgi:small subunit ribosomal protein S20
MAIKKSSKRAHKKSLRKRKHNLWYKNEIKKRTKELQKMLKAKEVEKAKEYLSKVYQIIDKAAKENVIKRGKACRLKSKFAKLISKALA